MENCLARAYFWQHVIYEGRKWIGVANIVLGMGERRERGGRGEEERKCGGREDGRVEEESVN